MALREMLQGGVRMRTFSETQPKSDREEGERPSLADGMNISITDVIITDKTKYGELAKVNGYDNVKKQAGKWRTTGKVLIKQLKFAMTSIGVGPTGQLKEPFSAQVVKGHNKDNGTYLMFKDAPA
jgi:hypothetical protein